MDLLRILETVADAAAFRAALAGHAAPDVAQVDEELLHYARFRGAQPRLFDEVAREMAEYECRQLTLPTNFRSLRAIVDGVGHALASEGIRPSHVEGGAEATWVLMDYGDVVVHVQLAEERIHYAIEVCIPTRVFIDEEES